MTTLTSTITSQKARQKARQLLVCLFSGETRTTAEDLALFDELTLFVMAFEQDEAEIERLRSILKTNALLGTSSVGAPALAAEKMRLACLACLKAPDRHAAQRAMERLKIEEVIRG